MDQGVPRYLRIYRDLSRAIERGELKPGDRLAGERELSRQFGVSLMTVRQALQQLQDERLIERHHGVGTFVAPRWIDYSLDQLGSFGPTLGDQEIAVETRVLSAGPVAAPPAVAAALNRPDAPRLYLLERLRLVAGTPIVHQRSYLAAEAGERLAGVDFDRVPLYEALAERLGWAVRSAEERLYAVALKPPEARLLDQKAGSPALLSERLTRGEREQPLVLDEALLPGNRLRLRVERGARQAPPLVYEMLAGVG